MEREHPEGAYDMESLEGYAKVVDTIDRIADRPPELTREQLIRQAMRGFDSQLAKWKVER